MSRSARLDKSHRLRMALFVLGFLTLVLISGTIVRIVNTISSPWKLPSDQYHKYSLNQKFNVNFIIKSNSISLVVFNPTEKKITIVNIPDEVYIEAGRFGKWKLKSLYDLGESTRVGLGSNLLKQSFSSLFGMPVDGYIGWDQASPKGEAREIVELMRQKVVGGVKLLPNIESDFTPWELIRLSWAISNVRFDKVILIDLDNLNLLDEGRLPDGTTALAIDPVKVDSLVRDFIDPKLREENIPIGIFNATDHPNLAHEAQRLITNMGGNVIYVGNVDKILKTSLRGESSETFQRLNQIFNLCEKDTNCDKIEPEELDTLGSRAKINIFLGEDYFQKINVQPKD